MYYDGHIIQRGQTPLKQRTFFDIDYYPLTAIPVIDMHEMR